MAGAAADRRGRHGRLGGPVRVVHERPHAGRGRQGRDEHAGPRGAHITPTFSLPFAAHCVRRRPLGLARPAMIWAAAVLASQRQPALVPEALSKAKPDKGPPLSLDQINKVYDNGHPSNKLSAGPESAGLVVHMYDLTERVGTGQMYQPGDAQFQEFWATSVVNRNMPGMYEPPTGGGECNGVGILINPKAAKVL